MLSITILAPNPQVTIDMTEEQRWILEGVSDDSRSIYYKKNGEVTDDAWKAKFWQTQDSASEFLSKLIDVGHDFKLKATEHIFYVQ